MLSSSHLTRIISILFFFGIVCSFGIAQDKPKISYGVLLDSTGSMRSQFTTVVNIGKTVVHQTYEHGPISIFNFASEGPGRESKAVPIMRNDPSQDEALLNRTIDGLYVQGGQTTLLDAIQVISDHLQRSFPDGDKIIVLVTDGEDRVSKARQKELIQQLIDRKIKVFAVGLVRELESDKRSKATELLNKLAKETGGVAVISKSGDVDVQSVVMQLGLPKP